MSKTITLVEIARKLKLNPKQARRKLRNMKTGHRLGNSWVFPVARRAAVVKMLQA